VGPCDDASQTVLLSHHRLADRVVLREAAKSLLAEDTELATLAASKANTKPFARLDGVKVCFHSQTSLPLWLPVPLRMERCSFDRVCGLGPIAALHAKPRGRLLPGPSPATTVTCAHANCGKARSTPTTGG
jgi:hypothetical protein